MGAKFVNGPTAEQILDVQALKKSGTDLKKVRNGPEKGRNGPEKSQEWAFWKSAVPDF